MKKILFVLSDLERGGIPRVTLNLIAVLAPAQVETDIFCGNPKGIFCETLQNIQHAKLLPGSWLLRAMMCNYRKEKGGFKYYALFIKVFRLILQKILRKDLLTLAEKYIGKKLSLKNYDVVFACSEGIPADIVLQIRSNKRCVWIHNDYGHDSSVNMPGLKQKLEAFDTIICAAEHARLALRNSFPELSERTCTVYNIVNTEEILKKAQELTAAQCFPDVDKMNIVSIGRFNEAPKRFSMIPQICAELKKRGIAFCWYLIGNGSPAETQILLDAVKKYEPGDSFVMLGEKSNPYPYLKYADLFALTSRYETYPTVINEAKALGTPVISTDFKGVEEIMTPDDGFVVPIEQFADAIERFCLDDRKAKVAKNFDRHNENVLKQFYQILE